MVRGGEPFSSLNAPSGELWGSVSNRAWHWNAQEIGKRVIFRKFVSQMEVRNWRERLIIRKLVILQMEVRNWRKRSIIRKLVERIFILNTISRLLVEVLCPCGLVRHVYRRLWCTELQGIS